MRCHHLGGQRYIRGMCDSASPKDYLNILHTNAGNKKKMAVAAAIPDTSLKCVRKIRLTFIIANLTLVGNG